MMGVFVGKKYMFAIAVEDGSLATLVNSLYLYLYNSMKNYTFAIAVEDGAHVNCVSQHPGALSNCQ